MKSVYNGVVFSQSSLILRHKVDLLFLRVAVNIENCLVISAVSIA